QASISRYLRFSTSTSSSSWSVLTKTSRRRCEMSTGGSPVAFSLVGELGGGCAPHRVFAALGGLVPASLVRRPHPLGFGPEVVVVVALEYPGRVARHQGAIRHVLGHHGKRRDRGEVADGDARHDHAVAADE